MAHGKSSRIPPIGARLAETPRQLDVLRVIRDHGIITRAEIGTLLQSSASQVSRLTAPLIARKVVSVEPRLPHVEGRPTDLLTLTPDTHYVVGLDVGGLAQDAVVTNLRGDVVGAAQAAGPSPATRSSIISGLVDLVHQAIRDSAVPPDQILGTGVGVRAIIDPTSGVISAGPETPSWSPEWVDFDLRHELMNALPWDRLVIDDTVRALAAAERQYGNARGVDDFVYVFADSGIGAALTIDGRAYIGPGHLAGEIGHIMLDHDGPVCGCGRRGCLEMYASTSAMLGRGQRIDPGVTSMTALIERAHGQGSPFHQILLEGGSALGRAIAILLNLLSPALVVIGGGATRSTPYMESLRNRAESEALEQPFRTARIVQSELHANSGAIGAATLMLNQLFGAAAPYPPVGRSSQPTSSRPLQPAKGVEA